MQRCKGALLLGALWLSACGDEDPQQDAGDAAISTPESGADASDLPATSEVLPDAGTIDLRDAATLDAASDASTDAALDAARDARAPDVPDAALAVTYADVAPIFETYCVTCHAPGGKAPFGLDNYSEASSNAAEAVAAASDRVMPPCAKEDPSCGPTTAELAKLRAWLLQGTPED
jgi:mono/diheme cytochrome c family protein